VAAQGSSGPASLEPDRDDADLVSALRAQDPAVAGPLWQRFAPAIARMLRRILGPQAPIDDAVQVVLLCVFRRGRRLRRRSDLGPLVVKLTARIAQGELMRQRLRRLAPGARARAGASAAAGRVPDRLERCYRILDRLSAGERVAFVLHQIEGLDVREVAAATGTSADRTSRLLRRAHGKVVAGIEEGGVSPRRSIGS
jgi:RNA polymerase sigma-70 factor (ECF subfamily)